MILIHGVDKIEVKKQICNEKAREMMLFLDKVIKSDKFLEYFQVLLSSFLIILEKRIYYDTFESDDSVNNLNDSINNLKYSAEIKDEIIKVVNNYIHVKKDSIDDKNLINNPSKIFGIFNNLFSIAYFISFGIKYIDLDDFLKKYHPPNSYDLEKFRISYNVLSNFKICSNFEEKQKRDRQKIERIQQEFKKLLEQYISSVDHDILYNIMRECKSLYEIQKNSFDQMIKFFSSFKENFKKLKNHYTKQATEQEINDKKNLFDFYWYLSKNRDIFENSFILKLSSNDTELNFFIDILKNFKKMVILDLRLDYKKFYSYYENNPFDSMDTNLEYLKFNRKLSEKWEGLPKLYFEIEKDRDIEKIPNLKINDNINNHIISDKHLIEDQIKLFIEIYYLYLKYELRYDYTLNDLDEDTESFKKLNLDGIKREIELMLYEYRAEKILYRENEYNYEAMISKMGKMSKLDKREEEIKSMFEKYCVKKKI